ncbi:MAG TPA: hypothetical protein VLY24_05985 [Bryobacteraceae bacterium]|nr:hypothetical protein [Bryobacteraceae bacterium]
MRPLSILCLVMQAAYGQALLVDRSLSAGQGMVRLGVPQGFLGDHFALGARGEVWVVDRLAVWAVADPNREAAERFGDLFGSVKLFGGIEADLPAPGQPAQPDCACHNLVVLKSGTLQPGMDAADTAEIQISAAAPGTWRVEFNDVRWSAPGGVPLQFGILATGRAAGHGQPRPVWFNSAAANPASHDLRLFDENGKLLGRYAPDGGPLDPAIGFHVQVWGHRSND